MPRAASRSRTTAFLRARARHKAYVGEVNATGLAPARVTSHVPLRAVADLITEDAVVDATRIAATRCARRRPHPRIAVAGLNPHMVTAASSGARRSK